MKLVVPLTMPITRRDVLAHQRLAQRPHDGDAAGDRRLEQQVDPGASAAANSSAPTLASSSLLAVTTGLPAAGGGDELPRRLDAADDLDHHVDRRIGDHNPGDPGQLQLDECGPPCGPRSRRPDPRRAARGPRPRSRSPADGAVVVLAGRPGRFSGGFDLPTLTAFTPASADLLKAGFDLSYRLLSFPRPVVIACTGHAIAMGSFLVLSADHRIGISDGGHKIGATEVAIGMAMPWAAVEILRQRLTRAAFDRSALSRRRWRAGPRRSRGGSPGRAPPSPTKHHRGRASRL
jgi:hypothetical protein